MQFSYYERNVEHIRSRNKIANREYYKQNKAEILRKRRYRYMASKRVKASYFDLLPFDIKMNIFQKKHELEFKQVLNIIDKLKHATTISSNCNVSFDMALNKTLSPVCDIHMRNGLLTPISTRSNMLIDLSIFSRRCFFYTSCKTIKHVQQLLDVELLMSYKNKRYMSHAEQPNTRFKYDCANIKFNQKRNNNPVLVIEIVEVLRLLNLSYDDPDPNTIGTLLVYDIGVHYRTRQRDIVSIDAITD